MSDRKCAQTLVQSAELDLAALRAMSDNEAFADEIVGFHAQQAAEKLLKAWIAIHGQMFQLTHNLGVLLDALRDHEPEADRFRGLIALNPFAVQFRYEAISGDMERLDRKGLARSLQSLMESVQAALGEPAES